MSISVSVSGQPNNSVKSDAQLRHASLCAGYAGRLNSSFLQSPMAATGRQHSATNGCFWEAKLQRQLSGDELEETSVA